MPPVGVVFVVDNGSTDSTADIARAAGATVINEPSKGYGNACQAGIREAAASGFEVVVILDGDHSFIPQELERLVAPILMDEADMVLGDRTQTAAPGAITFPQRFGNLVATRLIHAASGFRYQDMGPFRAIRTSSLVSMQMRDPNYGWNVEMQLKAIQRGCRVMEIPVTCRNRIAGQSKISGSLSSALRCGLKMMWATLRYAR